MGNETSEIVVGANGTVYVGAVGAELPTSIDDPVDEALFVDLGYLSEDGVKATDGKTVESIRAWQSFYDLRRIITAREFSVVFTLQQFAGAQVELAFGGGDVTEDAVGAYRYTPPSPELLDERSMIAEWADGEKAYRLILPRGMVQESVEFNLVRTTNAQLPITFGVLGSDDEDPWFLQTNDPAFAAFVGS